MDDYELSIKMKCVKVERTQSLTKLFKEFVLLEKIFLKKVDQPNVKKLKNIFRKMVSFLPQYTQTKWIIMTSI